MTKESNHKKTALVTGASSGIGYELCKLFAHDGYNLVLIARNAPRLAQLASELKTPSGATPRIIARDLSNPLAPEEIFAELERDRIFIDVLVNNAGFGTYGFFAESNTVHEEEMINLNILSVVKLTRLFLPAMLKNASGKILNVASTAAFQPGPLMAGYYASKAFVLSFSEALSNELRGTGITATALCPGPTLTDFQKRSGIENTRLFGRGMTMDAATVARIGYRAMMDGKTTVIAGFQNRLLRELTRIVPRSFAASVVRFIQERKK